jgi:hypothetical protein
MATFATDTELKALQSGFSNHTTAQLTASRNAAYSRIVSALYHGGYAVSTITAAPTTWPSLTLLEVRIAALDLLGGGAASRQGIAGGDNWPHWEAWVKAWLSEIENGTAALIDSTGAITNPPRSNYNSGIEYESRDPGVNLDEPANWPDADLLDVAE